ncbi:phenolic glucoside malonyltransferase 1-like [Cryptomeria japonica]|uniref:phenolic glucoside malonyltransferase 1-like n=1 Tax=Cryptomeria japonica TaxID=3369 RepID=UPI0027DA0897|nr:phenolic glucoside malonyltransferase 1-like [Cryptomeria japonica]
MADEAAEAVVKFRRTCVVTTFEGGGMCIGTTLHHAMADGNSFWHFMTSWAECSRGITIAKPPQLDRTVVRRGKKNPLSISYKAYEIVSNEMTGAKVFKLVAEVPEHLKQSGSGYMEKPKETLEKWVDPSMKTEVIYSAFCFTEEIIQDLKQRSGASSSFVAVAAQFWRCVMRAREVPQEETVYWEYGTNVISSPRFRVYDIDYGWGKPLEMQTATMNEIGAMFLSCAKDGGKSILVSTCLPQHQMDLLHRLMFLVGE